MIRESKYKSFNAVIVWKQDRFARRRADAIKYKAILKSNGVKVLSSTESNVEGPDGIIMESVMEGLAEYYSADLSEKVQRGFRENVIKGKVLGGTRLRRGRPPLRNQPNRRSNSQRGLPPLRHGRLHDERHSKTPKG